jgi:hypothetical protein
MTTALTYTAATISFDAATRTISDSANGFNFIAGTRLRITGSASNNKDVTLYSVATGALVINTGETLTNESAGATVTLSVLTPVQYIIREVAAVVGAVSNIRQAPTNPNETQSVDPFAVTYLANGVINISPIATKKDLLNVVVDVLIARTDLARNIATLTPFVDSVPYALVSEASSGGDLFSNTIQTFGGVQIQFLPQVDYANKQMIGYRFVMQDVKVLVNL